MTLLLLTLKFCKNLGITKIECFTVSAKEKVKQMKN